MNRLKPQHKLLIVAGLTTVVLVACTVPNLDDTGRTTGANDTSNVPSATDPGAQSPGDTTTATPVPGDPGSTVVDPTGADNAGDNPVTDPNTDPASGADPIGGDAGTADNPSDPTPPGSTPPPGDGGQSGGGTPPPGGGDTPPPGGDETTIPPTPCTPTLVGFATNPGPGMDDTPFVPGLEFDGPQGAFVTINPVIPVFGGTSLDITASSVGTVTFKCLDQITFGVVTFTDLDGNVSSPGELTLQRGVDFACGQPMTVRFSLPCNITLVP